MKSNIILKSLLIGAMLSASALADMDVDKSTGVLVVTSTITGTVIAKVIGPDDKIVVNEKYEGNSFSWTPSGNDGAYRYDVRVIPTQKGLTTENNEGANTTEVQSKQESAYAGGSVELKDGQILTNKEEE